MIISELTSRLSLSLLLCSTCLQYLEPAYLIENARTYVFLHDFTYKYTKNVLVGSPAVLVRDEIHCNKYPGTRRVMSVGYRAVNLVLVSTLHITNVMRVNVRGENVRHTQMRGTNIHDPL